MSTFNASLILKALEFAAEKHRGQIRRSSGLPYVIHPVAVSYLLQQYVPTDNENMMIASLLHDTIEDTDTNFEELVTTFNHSIASIVQELTSNRVEIARHRQDCIDRGIPVKEAKGVGKNEYLKEKLLNISSNSLTVKLVDRLSNIIDNPSEQYVRMTLELMSHLRENRSDLTEVQLDIINDIQSLCNKS